MQRPIGGHVQRIIAMERIEKTYGGPRSRRQAAACSQGFVVGAPRVYRSTPQRVCGAKM
jgi:hypothetical protein